MNWSFQNDAPIYAQLIEQIKAAIVTRVFPSGERLPSVRDLALEAGVNPNTMQRALAQLEAEGLVYSQRTAGRFVTEDESRIDALRRDLAQEHVARFVEAMHSLGLSAAEVNGLIAKAYGKENDEHECP